MSRILVVDDDVDLAELVKTKLASEGHEVHCINSGEGAFELAKHVKPDIAVLDIMLPGVTGYQICRRIRKDPELYRMAILILTALGEEPEVFHGLEQGADDYLVKPFKLDGLIEKITSMDALLEAITKRNPLTNLPGTDAIKREINHRLARGTAIASCYIDMVGFKPYCAAYGREGQQRALEFAAKMLTQLIRNMGIYEFFISHMGGEHFVVLVNLEDYERFCATLIRTFDQMVNQLYSPRQYKSAKKMFEVLAQARQMAVPDGKSVVFVDRRRTDR
ncbi:MAG: response regulator [Candidatus Hydrogenedentes bacterium]|nr:response regulator [Candidatus Hydrogenedentota bacterium]